MNEPDSHHTHKNTADFEVARKLRLGFPLTIYEAARVTSTHPESVRRACRLGRLKGTRPVGHRDWRVTREALAEWLRIPVTSLVPEGEVVA